MSRSVIRVRASYAAGELSVPKSGKVRSVPMVAEVAEKLAKLNAKRGFTREDDLVFCELDGTWLNDDRLRRRYEARSSERDCAACASTNMPHVRLTRDHAGGHRGGPGVDGAHRYPDDDAIPALPRSRPGG